MGALWDLVCPFCSLWNHRYNQWLSLSCYLSLAGKMLSCLTWSTTPSLRTFVPYFSDVQLAWWLQETRITSVDQSNNSFHFFEKAFINTNWLNYRSWYFLRWCKIRSKSLSFFCDGIMFLLQEISQKTLTFWSHWFIFPLNAIYNIHSIYSFKICPIALALILVKLNLNYYNLNKLLNLLRFATSLERTVQRIEPIHSVVYGVTEINIWA